MCRPDFFIVGAPKCGTTAMNDYLKDHPEIFIPTKKQLHSFGSDLELRRPRRITEQEYLSYFARARDKKRLGEASVWYLYSQEAAAEIKAFNPAARVIIMLRNPVDMMYSMHSQRLYSGKQDVIDFAEALEAEEERRQGLRTCKDIFDVKGASYRAAATYTPQVQRYFDVFGRERVHVIIFDDFAHATAQVYQATCKFLQVAPYFQPEFRIVNANKGVYSTTLRSFLHSPPWPTSWLLKLLGRSARQGFKGWVRQLNTRYETQPPMDSALRRRLQDEFASEVERLGALLGRDLTQWCQPTEA